MPSTDNFSVYSHDIALDDVKEQYFIFRPDPAAKIEPIRVT